MNSQTTTKDKEIVAKILRIMEGRSRRSLGNNGDYFYEPSIIGHTSSDHDWLLCSILEIYSKKIHY